jgi:hypothetical protein
MKKTIFKNPTIAMNTTTSKKYHVTAVNDKYYMIDERMAHTLCYYEDHAIVLKIGGAVYVPHPYFGDFVNIQNPTDRISPYSVTIQFARIDRYNMVITLYA